MLMPLSRPANPVSPWDLGPHPLQFSELRLENTNRCAYRCFFCPRESMTRTQGFMSLEDLALILKRLGPNTFEGRVDLHGFGEPLLDRGLQQKLALLKQTHPQATPRIFSTLGVRVGETCFEDLVKAGLRIIEVSFYGFEAEAYRKVHGVGQHQLAQRNLADLCQVLRRYPDQLQVVVRAFPTHEEVKPPQDDPSQREALYEFLLDHGVALIRERALHNYGDGRVYNRPGRGRPCSVTWGYRRRILQVTWNLDVIPCCFDFNADICFGNLRNQTLAEIFHGDRYRSFIAAHLEDRPEGPCVSCERCYQE